MASQKMRINQLLAEPVAVLIITIKVVTVEALALIIAAAEEREGAGW
jgi:hypothetical protein